VKVEFALDTVPHSGKAVTVINYCALKARGGLEVCVLS
jgi:hypothetical protein